MHEIEAAVQRPGAPGCAALRCLALLHGAACIGRYDVVRALGALAFITPILWYCVFGLNGKAGSGYIARNAMQMAETVNVPMSVFAMAIPVGFGLILIHLLAHLGTELTRKDAS